MVLVLEMDIESYLMLLKALGVDEYEIELIRRELYGSR